MSKKKPKEALHDSRTSPAASPLTPPSPVPPAVHFEGGVIVREGRPHRLHLALENPDDTSHARCFSMLLSRFILRIAHWRVGTTRTPPSALAFVRRNDAEDRPPNPPGRTCSFDVQMRERASAISLFSGPEDCCQNNCKECVWAVYYYELKRYNERSVFNAAG